MKSVDITEIHMAPCYSQSHLALERSSSEIFPLATSLNSFITDLSTYKYNTIQNTIKSNAVLYVD